MIKVTMPSVWLGPACHRRRGSALVVLSASIALLLPAAASAQNEGGNYELTAYGAYRFGGTFESEDSATTVELDDHRSAGLILNIRESANTQWEIIYSHENTAADTSAIPGLAYSTDVDVDYLQGGGTYQGDGTSARPYLAATIGGTRIAPRVPGLNSETFWSFSIGAGLQIRPSDRLGIRLEARAWGTLIESDTTLFCLSGVQGASCGIRMDGRVLWQLETIAGIVVRF